MKKDTPATIEDVLAARSHADQLEERAIALLRTAFQKLGYTIVTVKKEE
jgi:hypothetical protein